MSEQYATKEATVAKLKELGFIEVDDETFDSPKNDHYGFPVIQVYVYQCQNGYWCVDVWGMVGKLRSFGMVQKQIGILRIVPRSSLPGQIQIIQAGDNDSIRHRAM